MTSCAPIRPRISFSPVLFELVRARRYSGGAFQAAIGCGGGKWVVPDHLRGGVVTVDTPRGPLPVAVSLGVLLLSSASRRSRSMPN